MISYDTKKRNQGVLSKTHSQQLRNGSGLKWTKYKGVRDTSAFSRI